VRIACLAPNLIGDAVMATPTLRALRHGFPNAQLILVAKPPVIATLAGLDWFDQIIPCDPRSPNHALHSQEVARQLRQSPLDLAVLFPNSIRSAWLAFLARARRRLGYARGGRGILLTDRLHPPRDRRGRFIPSPIVSYYARLATYLNCPIDSLRLELETTPEAESAANHAWAQLGIPVDAPVVCLNTGGAFGPAKRWPEERFAELAQRLVDRHKLWCLVICGPDEREAARRITQFADRDQVRSLAEQPLSIGLSKAAVKRAALMITTDSGPRHFAAAFSVPVVTLFGPTHIAWTRTHHPQAIHLQQPVPCGPCQRGICPLKHHRCMQELTIDTVYQAALQLLHIARPSEFFPRSSIGVLS
jgi:heptosyltransferase-2